MYNASDASLNAQININTNMDRIVKIKIIIYKYINEILFYYIMSCF